LRRRKRDERSRRTHTHTHTHTQAPPQHLRQSISLILLLSLFRTHLRRCSPAQPFGGRYLPLVAWALASTPRRAVAAVPSDANGLIPPRAPVARRCHPHRHHNNHRRVVLLVISSASSTYCTRVQCMNGLLEATVISKWRYLRIGSSLECVSKCATILHTLARLLAPTRTHTQHHRHRRRCCHTHAGMMTLLVVSTMQHIQ